MDSRWRIFGRGGSVGKRGGPNLTQSRATPSVSKLMQGPSGFDAKRKYWAKEQRKEEKRGTVFGYGLKEVRVRALISQLQEHHRPGLAGGNSH